VSMGAVCRLPILEGTDLKAALRAHPSIEACAAVIRDAAFLNWRYLQRPDQKYHAFGAYEGNVLVGYAVLKLYRDGEVLKGHIIDILFLPETKEIADFLIEESERFFLEHKTNIESAWVVGSEICREILSERGFAPVRPRPLVCRLNFDKEKYQRVIDGENWYFTMGDTTEIF